MASDGVEDNKRGKKAKAKRFFTKDKQDEEAKLDSSKDAKPGKRSGVSEDNGPDGGQSEVKSSEEDKSSRKSKGSGKGKSSSEGKSSRKEKRQRSSFAEQDASTAALEAIVFGQALDLHDDGAAVDVTGKERQPKSSAAKAPAQRNKRKRQKSKSAGESKPAWVDRDDATLQVDLTKHNRTKKLRKTDEEVKVAGDEYEKRLRQHFVKMHGTASWAEPRPEAADAEGSSEEECEDSEKLATSAVPTASGLRGAHGLLPTKIDIVRRQAVKIADPMADRKPAVMHALHFHPDSELMLAAGLDKTLRIFSIDGEDNPRISKHHFQGFPIRDARFTSDGDQVLLTGLHASRSLWSLDVRTGEPLLITPRPQSPDRRVLHCLTVGPHSSDAPGLRCSRMFAVLDDSGSIMICDGPSKQLVRTLRMPAPGSKAVFSKDRDVLWSADRDNNIYEWDLGTGRCKQRCKASWATGIWSLALRGTSANAPTPQLAVGTTSGNIDVYDISGPTFPKQPTLSFNNLVTHVSGLAYHPEGELLVGFSRSKEEQLKLMHCASGTVYQNWPTQRTPLNKVAAVAMSRKKGWLAFANEKGKVYLYQLSHYE
mmetsp:Transcript_32454/g.59254  ORF Transcript_32454/g.59254 Transcript_32454/m.59254 type:complete len:596 (+) Transcript_32454:99-1886(+)